jgi:hypothetical protein
MIPRCFPSVETNGVTKMQVNVLVDTTGLEEWVDFIPVINIDPATYTPNSYDDDGAIEVDVIDPTNKQAGLDYINVYEDGDKTIPWSTDADGYIPINYEVA